jgi:hypothetical protein
MYMCIGVSILFAHVSMIFRLGFQTVLTLWYNMYLVFHFSINLHEKITYIVLKYGEH